MSHRARLARYTDRIRNAGALTLRQLRQLGRMEARAGDRRAHELVWLTPPAPKRERGSRAGHAGAARTPARGSFATHVVVIRPGQKASQGKRIPRIEMELSKS